MNKIKIIWIIVSILLMGSLAGNAYWFGSKWLNQDRVNSFNTGASSMRNYIVETVQKNGIIIVENEKGEQIKLIQINE